MALLLALLLLPSAHAQQAPTLALGSYSYIVGETLELSASNLEPGGTYTLELTRKQPAESEGAGPTRVARRALTASGSGALTFRHELKEGGEYAVRVLGPRLDATLNIVVRGAESAVGSAPSEDGEAPRDDDERGVTPPAETPGEPSEEEGEEAREDAAEEAPVAEEAPGAARGEREAAPSEEGASTDLSFEARDGALVARSPDGETAWLLDFPAGTGETAEPVLVGDRLFAGRGNHVLELDQDEGTVLRRWRLPAQITALEVEGGELTANVKYAAGMEAAYPVPLAGDAPLLPFDPNPALYRWLRNEANVTNPAERLRADPTNPWLYLEVAEASGSQGARSVEELLDEALLASATFYEKAQLAEAFLHLESPRLDLANLAMSGAEEDFRARSYAPELLTDETLESAYGFPLTRLYAALGRGDMERAGFYADWVYRIYPAGYGERRAALAEYARSLQSRGLRDEASSWRSRANEAGGFSVTATLTNAAETVGRTGLYGVAALLVSIAALSLTLLAKYWRPQSLNLRRRREAGRPASPFAARLTFLRYGTLTEKLVMVLLFAATLALVALNGWATRVSDPPAALASGSLATPPAQESVLALAGSPRDALFVRAYAAQSVGDGAAAERAYASLDDDAAALNNLGVLLGDPAYFRRALELNAEQSAALANLDADVDAEGEGRLVVPDPERIRSARAGTYLAAVGAAFKNPWAALMETESLSLPTWALALLAILFLLLAAYAVIMLFVPRPRLARNAPRTLLYHLLSVLLPGTGLADEFFGVLLMVPWAIFGVDYLLHHLQSLPPPTMSLTVDVVALIIIYAVNLVAFFVEFASYRRRMQALRRNDPVTAREYGMRVPATDAP